VGGSGDDGSAPRPPCVSRLGRNRRAASEPAQSGARPVARRRVRTLPGRTPGTLGLRGRLEVRTCSETGAGAVPSGNVRVISTASHDPEVEREGVISGSRGAAVYSLTRPRRSGWRITAPVDERARVAGSGGACSTPRWGRCRCGARRTPRAQPRAGGHRASSSSRGALATGLLSIARNSTRSSANSAITTTNTARTASLVSRHR
jgi:hypothetical protein